MTLRAIGLLVGGVSVLLLSAGPSSSRAPEPVAVRTYQFRAKIKDNDGVTPFEVGKTISGKFTYDLRGNQTLREGSYARYTSKRNALALEYGELRFGAAGEVAVTIQSHEHFEHFGLEACDVVLPKGWEAESGKRPPGYFILLQNDPPRKVIDGVAIPTGLSLSDFKSTAELRLEFFHGVRFPGGAIKGRATVLAPLEKLEEVRP